MIIIVIIMIILLLLLLLLTNLITIIIFIIIYIYSSETQNLTDTQVRLAAIGATLASPRDLVLRGTPRGPVPRSFRVVELHGPEMGWWNNTKIRMLWDFMGFYWDVIGI